MTSFSYRKSESKQNLIKNWSLCAGDVFLKPFLGWSWAAIFAIFFLGFCALGSFHWMEIFLKIPNDKFELAEKIVVITLWFFFVLISAIYNGTFKGAVLSIRPWYKEC